MSDVEYWIYAIEQLGFKIQWHSGEDTMIVSFSDQWEETYRGGTFFLYCEEIFKKLSEIIIQNEVTEIAILDKLEYDSLRTLGF